MKFSLLEYLLLILAVAVIAFLATPVFRKIARKAKILDYPGGRKLQSAPIAYLGGLAIVTPITFGSLLIVFSTGNDDASIGIRVGFRIGIRKFGGG